MSRKGTPLTRRLARKNREQNDRFPPVSGYVRTQRSAPVRALSYGCAHMDYNGCEVIAAYHALLSLGRPQSLQQTAEELCCFPRSLWLFGVFGTRPGALPRYFEKRGFSVFRVPRRAFRRGTFRLPGGDIPVYIYSYWNPRFRGIHTVELHRTPCGWVVYNYMPLYGRCFPSPENLLSAIPTACPVCLTGIAFE